jgi:osmotically-inducible protein OsmY
MVLTIDLSQDEKIQRDVLEELHSDLEIKPTDIGVEVDEGIVTLMGTVSTFHKKWAAEHAALRVFGVRGTVNNIEVTPAPVELASDEAIAHAAATSIHWDTTIPDGRVKVRVHDGRVILEGVVDRYVEKAAAVNAVQRLPGVRDVTDLIQVNRHNGPIVEPEKIKLQIERAFMRNAEVDARRIQVAVHGSYVTLAGNVRTWTEREAAFRAAWRIPGITRVDNQLRIVP